MQPGPSHIETILTRLQLTELAAGSPPTLTHIVSLERRWVFILYLPVLSGFPYIANCKWGSFLLSSGIIRAKAPAKSGCGDWWWLISLFSSFTYFGNVLIFNLFHFIFNLQSQGSSEEWVGTVMGYLTSVQQGGHTVFPRCSRRTVFLLNDSGKNSHSWYSIVTKPTNFL